MTSNAVGYLEELKMAGLFESIFDALYLILVISIGIKLLLIEDKSAKTFGIMGVVLGLGDSFHLVPRIMAHMTQNGMEQFAPILSWGKMITSITMTIFYLLYYKHYKKENHKENKTLDYTIYLLTIVRIILTILPQNKWGTSDPNLTWNIIRNIPFTIMGIILIAISYKEKGLFRKYSILIALSFIFYVPVVLFTDKYAIVGMLMMPKTVAYFMLVYVAYKHYKTQFKTADILETALITLIFGLSAGVFFREFTKIFAFKGKTMLSVIHTHTLILGFVFGIILYLLLSRIKNVDYKKIKMPMKLWNAGLVLTIAMMWIKGIYQVIGENTELFNQNMFSGIAGLGHIALGVGIVWMMLYIVKESKLQIL